MKTYFFQKIYLLVASIILVMVMASNTSIAQSINGPSPVYENESHVYTYTAEVLGNYTWVINGGTAQTSATGNGNGTATYSITVYWTNAGSRSVKFTVGHNNTVLATKNVTVQQGSFPPPAPPTNISGSDRCGAGTVSLSATPAGWLADQVWWYDCLTRCLRKSTNNTYTPSVSTGTHTFYAYSYSTTTGLKSTNYSSITVTAQPNLSAGSINGTKTICYNASAGVMGNSSSASGGSGSYSYEWWKKPTSGQWTRVTGAIGTTYSPGNLTQTTQYYRWVVDNVNSVCGGKLSNTVTVTVASNLSAGSINGTKSICNNTSAGTLGNTGSASGGIGTRTYQWQRKIGSGSWTNVSGAASSSYSPGNLTTTTQYRRRVVNTCGTKYTNTVTVTVYPNFSAGSITGSTAICYNTSAGFLENGTLASGGTGGMTYQWQQKIGSGSWNNIPGATGTRYNTGNLTTTTQYRRKVVNTCGTKYSNTLTVTVHPDLLAGNIGVDEVVCSGTSGSTLGSGSTATGGTGTMNYQWEYKVGTGSWGDISGATATTYNPGNMTTTTEYRRRVTNTCGTKHSNVVTFTVSPSDISGNIIGDYGTYCFVASEGTLTVDNKQGDVKYWEKSIDGQNSWVRIDAPSHVLDFYEISYENIVTTTSYRAAVSSLHCGPDLTTPITIQIDADATCGIPPLVTDGDNYVRAESIQIAGITDESQVTNLPIGDKLSVTNYFDYLNRPIQTVARGSSTLGNDIVQPYEYNGFNRPTKSYLSYVANSSGGLLQSDALVAQSTFYATPPSGVATSATPYAENKYDESLSGRVLERGAPGDAWQLGTNGHAVKYTYRFNTTNEVRKWLADGTSTGYHTINTIHTSEMVNENGFQTISYTDVLGKLVQKKEQLASGWVVTTYIYDALDRLKYILPPEALEELGAGSSLSLTPSFIDDWVFEYVYDDYGRVVEKKVPGKGTEYIIYDKWNRALLTQNALLRANNKWQFVKYDKDHRPIMFGLYTDATNTTRAAMQAVTDLLDYNGSDQYYEVRQANTSHGYTEDSSFPTTNIEVQSVNYYDDYDANYDGTNDYSYDATQLTGQEATTHGLIRGFPTASKTKILDGGNNWLTSVYFYDEDGNIIQTRTDNHLGKVDLNTAVYNFSGELLKTRTVHNSGQIVWTDLVGMKYNDEKLTKTAANGWTNGGAASMNKLASDEDGWVEMQVLETNVSRMFGLSETNQNASWTSISYAIFLVNGGDAQIRESGSGSKASISYTTGDIFRIERINGIIYYSKNGVTFYTSNTSSTNNLIIDVSLNHSGGTIYKAKASFGEKIEVNERYVYDPVGRLLEVYHQVNSDPEQMISQYHYNELGQLMEKNLHQEAGGFLQSVDLQYNIRGWLTSINNTALTEEDSNNADDMFGMELQYDNATNAQYNGNIGAIAWNKSGDKGVSKYDFGYDNINRLTDATHSLDAVNNSDFDMSAGYDLNGNITSLDRYNVGNQMDSLSYTYSNNQLMKVVDRQDTNGFEDGNTVGDDFIYDANGNMTEDKNKGIANIAYNHLDKPTVVTFTDGRKIENTYDAGGSKLTQKTYDTNGTTLLHTTDYVGSYLYEDNTLQYVHTSEGRVVKDPVTNSWEYQYHITDHLGNVRTMFTSAPKTVEFNVNYENDSNLPDDIALFDNKGNIIDADIHDHTDTGSTYTQSQKLTGASGSIIGSVLTIPVKPGDKISAEVYAKYLASTGAPNPAISVAAAVMGAITGNTGSTNYEGAINGTVAADGSLINALGNGVSGTEPLAFINLMFLPEQVEATVAASHFAYQQVSSSSNGAHAILELSQDFEVPHAGYVIVYLSNESSTLTEVYFDDLKVTVNESNIIQATDYYPFGLQHSTSWTRETNLKNNRLFNAGSELNENTGNYETFYRNYDPAIGRFNSIDIQAASYHSMTPYQFAGNDPIYFNDPYGDVLFAPTSGRDGLNSYQSATFDGSWSSGYGGGSHWSNQYRSVGNNFGLMSSSNFSNLYGIDAMSDADRANFATGSGLGVRVHSGFISTFLSAVSSGERKLGGAVIDGNHYFMHVDGQGNFYKAYSNEQIDPYVLIPGSMPDRDAGIGLPGTGESMIPIWGSGRESIYWFQQGDWGGGGLYALAAISDIGGLSALGKAVGKGAVKVTAKGGLNLFKSKKPTTLTRNGWKEGDRMLHLPNQGTPKLNWKQNSGFLRQEMRSGNPIFDSYLYSNGQQIPTGGFLRAERYLLESNGWRFNASKGAYFAP